MTMSADGTMSSSSSVRHGGRYVVQLAIYDLSMGMARQLSSQFLGPSHTIDVIPHCGVVVHDLEYFYGMGIQHAPPNVFRSQRGIHPIHTITVGRTSVSKRDFDRWCREVASREYSPTSYDLLTRNCNNFADYALREGLGMDDGVPHWVLDVPRRFLESPMGQMFRPMLENMTAPVDGFDHEDGTGTTFGGGNSSGTGGGVANGAVAGGGNNPWAGAGTAGAPAVPAASTNGTSTTASGVNPWADVPSTKSASTSDSKAVKVEEKPEKPEEGTPLLDSHDRPLLSPDASAVPACVTKLSGGTAMASLSDDDTAREALRHLGEELTSRPPRPTSETVGTSLLPILRYLLKEGDGEEVEDEAARKAKATELAFALMLLRLVVLHDDGGPTSECLSLVADGLVARGGPLTGATARSMAWCVCGNAFSQPRLTPILTSDGLVEAALGDLNGAPAIPAPVRQAASAFLYNLALHLCTSAEGGFEDDVVMPDVVVTLLCGTLEGLHDEVEATVRFRRLLVVGKVLGGYRSSGATSLASDLGYGDVIGSIADGCGEDDVSRGLAGEVRSLILR